MQNLTYWHFAARDAAVILATYIVWTMFSHHTVGSGALADFTGIAIGGLLAISLHLVHEWGHCLGGFAGRSKMIPGDNMRSAFIFVFNSTENDKKQFLLMSFSGFLGTALVVWFSFYVLPDDQLASRIARGFAVLQVVLAIVIEVPLVVWALVGKGLPPIDKGKHAPGVAA